MSSILEKHHSQINLVVLYPTNKPFLVYPHIKIHDFHLNFLHKHTFYTETIDNQTNHPKYVFYYVIYRRKYSDKCRNPFLTKYLHTNGFNQLFNNKIGITIC